MSIEASFIICKNKLPLIIIVDNYMDEMLLVKRKSET